MTVNMGDKRDHLPRHRVVNVPKLDAHIRQLVVKNRILSAHETSTWVDAEVNNVTGTMDYVDDEEVDDNDEITESTTDFVVDQIMD